LLTETINTLYEDMDMQTVSVNGWTKWKSTLCVSWSPITR